MCTMFFYALSIDHALWWNVNCFLRFFLTIRKNKGRKIIGQYWKPL